MSIDADVTDPSLANGAGRKVVAGILWGLLAVGIWAGSFVLIQLGVRTTLSAYDLTALRFATAGILLLPVVWRRGWAVPRLGRGGLLLLIAGTGAPYALLIAIGLRYAPAAHAAALVPGVMAVMAAVLGTCVLAEKMAMRGWFGVALILVGTLVIGGPVLLRAEDAAVSVGHGLFLLAALLWAGYVVVLRRAGIAPLHATAIVAVGSALVYLPCYAAWAPADMDRAPLADIVVQAIYQGILTTVVGLLAFNRAVASLGVAGGAAMPALVPAATLFMGAWFLNEKPGSGGIAAAVLVGAGVLLVTISRSSKTNERSS